MTVSVKVCFELQIIMQSWTLKGIKPKSFRQKQFWSKRLCSISSHKDEGNLQSILVNIETMLHVGFCTVKMSRSDQQS